MFLTRHAHCSGFFNGLATWAPRRGIKIKQADGSILYEFEYEGHRLEQHNAATRYGNQTAGSEFMQG